MLSMAEDMESAICSRAAQKEPHKLSIVLTNESQRFSSAPNQHHIKFQRSHLMALEQITINIPPDVKAWAAAEAKKDTRTLAGFIRHVVCEAYEAAQPKGETAPDIVAEVETQLTGAMNLVQRWQEMTES